MSIGDMFNRSPLGQYLNETGGDIQFQKVLAAIAEQESGNSQYWKSSGQGHFGANGMWTPGHAKGDLMLGDVLQSGERAMGRFQLLPSTARGITNPNTGKPIDPYSEEENRLGASIYLHQLFDKYHDWVKTLEAYSGSQEFIGTGKVSAQQQQYATDVLTRAQNITINVNVASTNATSHEMKMAIVGAVNDLQKTSGARTLAETGGAR
jgi:hypothetical protein